MIKAQEALPFHTAVARCRELDRLIGWTLGQEAQGCRTDIVLGVGVEPGNGGADARGLSHELIPVLGLGRMGPAQQGFNFPAFPGATVGVGGVVLFVPTADITLSCAVNVQRHIVLTTHLDAYLLVLHGVPGIVVPVTMRVTVFQAQLVDVIGVQ